MLALVVGGCGGGEDADPIKRVPADGGLREKIAAAQKVAASDFPAVDGRSFADLAAQLGAREGEAALATSVVLPGSSRVAFGTIDDAGQFTYGKSAVYLAPAGADGAALGPFPAPADLLVTDPAYRSKQAAGEDDPFAAIYAAEVKVPKPGTYDLLTITQAAGGTVAGTGQIEVTTPAKDKIPAVGEKAPMVKTDTLAAVRGDRELLDTRQPPSDLHAKSFDEVLGKRPVALLFATPQLCQSRVCGPVVDVALELEARYGDRVEFIHQEVYKANDPRKGLRSPLVAFNLQTEPWLFVVDATGKITARLEGSFGLNAVDEALRTVVDG